MSEIVAVTGLMRSGTSLAAAILHRLGGFAGVYITAPMPPTWKGDWEDPWALDLMMEKKLKPKFFREWIDSKRESAGMYGFEKIQLKSPYLALHMAPLLEAAPDIFVVATNRDPGAVSSSMARHPQLTLKDQGRIRAALESVTPRYVFDCDHCQADPQSEIQSLCMALGLDPGSDLEEAAALVDQKKAEVF